MKCRKIVLFLVVGRSLNKHLQVLLLDLSVFYSRSLNRWVLWLTVTRGLPFIFTLALALALLLSASLRSLTPLKSTHISFECHAVGVSYCSASRRYNSCHTPRCTLCFGSIFEPCFDIAYTGQSDI